MFDQIDGVGAEALRGADESTVSGWCDVLASDDAEMEMWKMQDRGWKSGPWTRSEEEIT